MEVLSKKDGLPVQLLEAPEQGRLLEGAGTCLLPPPSRAVYILGLWDGGVPQMRRKCLGSAAAESVGGTFWLSGFKPPLLCSAGHRSVQKAHGFQPSRGQLSHTCKSL